ncbi:major capsid protein L1 [Human papillomavirus type 1a]|uniref:Major capsid protein L1 n=1 Tax=Human papillomavirus type 1 TaxID=10583 RepID=VL1_HPV1|nr:major capsid protein L1 [Mupapillomavirus 1]P03099.2 RecName: Full=Major capsid protein L1 [Human papillomavirus type 1a]CAA24318.1 major capsid protein L1 [Human papillomavirus type 1a]
MYNVFQMAVWLPAQNKFYLPPQPITRILSTDEYVTRTNLFYHATSERLLLVGHPLFEISSNQTVTIPKVSPNAFRVFRVRFADPNRFAFGDKAIFNPETERLVWGLRGIEIGRGQPLGIGITGHPLLNKLDDAENPTNYINTHANGDSRQNTAFDAKQTQMFLVGCTPASGEHWTSSRCPGEQVKLGDCPRVQMIESVIEDGDMMDIGFGAMDFAALQQDKSDVPLDVVQATCKYPDYIRMNHEAYGNSMFFFARREQMYTRHFFTRGGSVGDKEAVPQSLYLTADAEPRTTLATTNYVGTPSGSMVSSDVQLFNRSYWLQRCQGQNNGICWRNQLFITVGDNTRGTSLSISMKNNASTTYSNANFNDFLRHTEEFDLSFIVQLCKVKLTPENLAYIHTMDPNILEDWQLSVSQPPTNPLEDQYRFLGSSLAAKCPEQAPPEPQTDPYSQYKFWEVDLTERMSEQLDQFPLGRKFLYQSGMTQRTATSSTTKRKTVRVSTSAKRRRKA